MRLFSNRSQRTSKCGKNKKMAHEAQPSVSLMFCIYLSRNLFIKWTDEAWSELSNDETFFQRDCVRKMAVCEKQMALMM